MPHRVMQPQEAEGLPTRQCFLTDHLLQRRTNKSAAAVGGPSPNSLASKELGFPLSH